jgi:hypothetical protein
MGYTKIEDRIHHSQVMRQKGMPHSANAWRHRTRSDFRLAIISASPLICAGDIGQLKYDGALHHIDFDPTNNAPENLHYFETRGKHTAFHTKLRNFVYNFIQANKSQIIFRRSDERREKKWPIDPIRNKLKCRKYRRENPNNNKVYYHSHIEKIKSYREQNREKNKEYDRQYYLNNKERRKAYILANKDKIRGYARIAYLRRKQKKQQSQS